VECYTCNLLMLTHAELAAYLAGLSIEHCIKLKLLLPPLVGVDAQ
jgi:hypothetical protein